jgi:serine/threonine-protein kinase
MTTAADQIGTTLGGRYRLEALLGTGASANVFLAQDTTLERQVAIKLLQPALAQDAAFLKRFRAEARAVAALNHPNVLRVFDWGEEEGVPFLVTELLAGGSLKDLLDAGVRLSHEQAASVGQQAAAGLAYAHARGLVHRDVKPGNLLFDEEGRVRITDFGVARALAEASWTEPAGGLIGTVRYASPEQAEGLPVDGKADVYSLSLVLYESLSGTVPFLQETPVATLRARIGQPLPHDPSLGPLDVALAQAASPIVEDRLDAAEFERRLESIAAALPPALPLPLAGVAAAAATASQFKAPSVDDLTQVTAAVLTTGPVPSGVAAPYDAVADEDNTIIGFMPPSDSAPVGPRHRRRWPWILVALVILGAGFAAFAIATKLFVPNVTVPNLIGVSSVKAEATLSKEHLTAVFEPSVYSTTVPVNDVIVQQPHAGTVLKQGSTVRLVASRGLPSVTVPSLQGFTCAQAQAALQTVHLKAICPPAAQQYSPTVPTGQTISYWYGSVTNPKTVTYGATVNIVISKGPPPVPIPQVSGTFAQAEATLVAAGFKVTEAKEYSEAVPVGNVTRTAPTVGTPIQKGTTVTVYVSLGPPLVTVPNLRGKTVAGATAKLQNVGLKVGAVYGPPGGTVFKESPGAGNSVKAGSAVNLYVQ